MAQARGDGDTEAPRDIEGREKSFCTSMGSRRLNKENVGLLLNGADDLGTVDADGMRYSTPPLS